MTVATNDRNEPQFHECVAWRAAAEFAGKFLMKGRLVYLAGWLHGRSWRAEDGTMRRSVEVVAETLRALTPRPQQQEEPDA
jgi:single-strand DNA-binding protein